MYHFISNNLLSKLNEGKKNMIPEAPQIKKIKNLEKQPILSADISQRFVLKQVISSSFLTWAQYISGNLHII